jgi:flagellar protein FlaJ
MPDFLSLYKRLSLRLFGKLVDSNAEVFRNLKIYMLASGLKVLLRTWVSMIFMTTLLVYVASVAGVAVTQLFFRMDTISFIYYLMFVPVLMASFSFLLFYVYPIQISKNIRKSIDNNLPFALAHMNAIVSSGIPPEFMFELLTGFKEYGAISLQSEDIVRNIKGFGMSSVDSMNMVAKRTPSPAFRQILNGMSSTIEKGGDLTDYIKEMSEKTLFDYRMKRDKYTKTLSTYADIYTSLLITAPLLMLSTLVMMSVIGGQVLGMGIQDILFLIIWIIIPALNVVFLAFVHVTYPGT